MVAVDVAAAEQREHQNSVVTEDGEGGEEEDRLSVTEGDVREADLRRIDGGMNVERFCKTDYCLIDAASQTCHSTFVHEILINVWNMSGGQYFLLDVEYHNKTP